MKELRAVQIRVLEAMAVRPTGSLLVEELKALYSAPGDGQRVNYLIRHGLADWIRERDGAPAWAIEITDAGRTALKAREMGK